LRLRALLFDSGRRGSSNARANRANYPISSACSDFRAFRSSPTRFRYDAMDFEAQVPDEWKRQ
jgi:hypothetical protein